MYIAVKIAYQDLPNPYYSHQNRSMEPETINAAVKDYLILREGSDLLPVVLKDGYRVYKIASEIRLQVVESVTTVEVPV